MHASTLGGRCMSMRMPGPVLSAANCAAGSRSGSSVAACTRRRTSRSVTCIGRRRHAPKMHVRRSAFWSIARCNACSNASRRARESSVMCAAVTRPPPHRSSRGRVGIRSRARASGTIRSMFAAPPSTASAIRRSASLSDISSESARESVSRAFGAGEWASADVSVETCMAVRSPGVGCRVARMPCCDRTAPGAKRRRRISNAQLVAFGAMIRPTENNRLIYSLHRNYFMKMTGGMIRGSL
ncbi:hypothetical protein Y034_5518 [Burkholderia pseudomallei MSHR449]|nr:hypothetical protein Y034_5518 [Burkholderia pseudomallei MSHR449]